MTIEETINFVNNPTLHLNDEIWQPHPIYDVYCASNYGRIKCIRTEKQQYTSNGMIMRKTKPFIVTQCFDKRFNRFSFNCYYSYKKFKHVGTQRFVLECFNGLNDYLFCNHINSVPYDNNIENLEWVTRKENNNNPNSRKKYKPSKTTNKTTKVLQIMDGNIIKEWNSLNDIEKSLNLNKRSSSNITAVCAGRQKTAYGYFWQYKPENMLLPNEIWKEHPVHTNIFVSNLGRIKRLRKNGLYYITYGGKHTCNYLVTEINHKKYLIHRLVAETFLENPLNKPYVNHINANIYDNKLCNLEWSTPSENRLSIASHRKTSHPVLKMSLDFEILKEYSSLKQACKDGFIMESIKKVCNGLKSEHKGFLWKYKES